MKRLITKKNKAALRERRHARVRATVKGTSECPRLSVYRSLRGMTVQLIDDAAGKTLCFAHSQEVKAKGKKTEISLALGKLIAEKAKAKKVAKVVFDRGGYKFHGRVKAVADGARENGLQF